MKALRLALSWTIALVLTGCGNSINMTSSSPGGGSGGSEGTGSGGSGTSGGSGSSGSSTSSGNEFLYATASGGGGTVYAWQIDASTGVLTPVSGEPFLANVGTENSRPCTAACSTNLAADPLGRFLFLAYNLIGDGVDSLGVDATTGTLTNIANLPIPAGAIAVDPRGQYLYGTPPALTIGGAIHLYGYYVAANGHLSEVPGSPYALGSAPASGSAVPEPPALSSSDVFVNLTYQSVSSIAAFHISPSNGSLTTNIALGGAQVGVAPAVTPSAKYLYAAEPVYPNEGVGQYEIVPYSMGVDGTFTTLQWLARVTPETAPFAILMAPNGSFLYALGNRAMYDYEINEDTGALSLIATYSASYGSWVVVDPAVKYVYLVPNRGAGDDASSDTIVGYKVNPATGELSEIAGGAVTLPQSPISLAVVRPQ